MTAPPSGSQSHLVEKKVQLDGLGRAWDEVRRQSLRKGVVILFGENA